MAKPGGSLGHEFGHREFTHLCCQLSDQSDNHTSLMPSAYSDRGKSRKTRRQVVNHYHNSSFVNLNLAPRYPGARIAFRPHGQDDAYNVRLLPGN